MSDVIRIYFDVDSLEEAFKAEFGEEAILDIVTFNVYESSSKGGTFALIDNVDFDPRREFIETDQQTSLDYWFRLAWVDSSSVESELSDPTLAENIERIIDNVIAELGDTDRNQPAFTDEEYLSMIRNSHGRISSSPNMVKLAESREYVVALLVRTQACFKLAYRNAGRYPIELPDGLKTDKGQRVDHYLDIAKALEKQWNEMKRDFGPVDEEGELTGTPKMQVIDTTKTTFFKDPGKMGGNRYGTGFPSRRG